MTSAHDLAEALRAVLKGRPHPVLAAYDAMLAKQATDRRRGPNSRASHALTAYWAGNRPLKARADYPRPVDRLAWDRGAIAFCEGLPCAPPYRIAHCRTAWRTGWHVAQRGGWETYECPTETPRRKNRREPQ